MQIEDSEHASHQKNNLAQWIHTFIDKDPAPWTHGGSRVQLHVPSNQRQKNKPAVDGNQRHVLYDIFYSYANFYYIYYSCFQ